MNSGLTLEKIALLAYSLYLFRDVDMDFIANKIR